MRTELTSNGFSQPSVDDHATSPAPLRSNSYISAAIASAVLATDAVSRSLSGGQRVVPMSTTFRAIPYDEIKFTSPTPLGHGTFGVVFVAEWRGSKVAVKKLLTFIDDDELPQLRVECALLQRCSNHPNVINFLGACLERGTVYIVTAFCLGGSVHDAFVVRRESFSNAETLRILRDSACGIMHLHKELVIHRNIAARNFLLDDRRNVFVTDFGLARVKTSVYQHTFSAMGPFKYMAPESIALQRYSERSDAFSFGVYIWAVLHRREPYANMEIFAVLTGIVDSSLRLAIDASLVVGEMRVLADLMHECWQADPLKRPSFDRIMKKLT
jgi:serine/threonine protein kinase